MINNEIFLCAINNCESGTCPEDCTFCTQSTKYKAKIQRYKKKSIEQIVKEAHIAKANKAVGYCLVTAGAGLTDERGEFISQAAKAIKDDYINFIKESKGTFGYYDILVKIEAPSEKQIENVVTKKIRRIENVITTTTLSVIKEQG